MHQLENLNLKRLQHKCSDIRNESVFGYVKYNITRTFSWVTTASFRAMWRHFRNLLHHYRLGNAIPEGLRGIQYDNAVKDIPWLVIWLDNHTTHIYDEVVMNDAIYHRVLFCSFIAHTTHVSQALDSGLNTAIKVSNLIHYIFVD